MKNRNALLMCLALPTIALPVAAAPKAKAARPQWEYAIVESGVMSGTVATLPQGRIIVESAYDVEVQARVLNRLGAQGWEVVAGTQDRTNSRTWTLKRRK